MSQICTVLVPDWDRTKKMSAIAAARRRLREYFSEFHGHELVFSADFKRDVIKLPGQVKTLPRELRKVTMCNYRIIKIQKPDPDLADGTYRRGPITLRVKTIYRSGQFQQIVIATSENASLGELNACFDRFTGKKRMYLQRRLICHGAEQVA